MTWALSVGVQALLTALALHPWTVVVSGMFQRANPFTWYGTAGWVFGAALLARLLGKRPRRGISHVIAHGLAVGLGFFSWLAATRGIGGGLLPLRWLSRTWWQQAGFGAGTAPLATEVFWLMVWGALWGWGIHLALRRVLKDRLMAEFGLGFFGWGLCLLLASAGETPTGPLLPALFAYFCTGLLWHGLTGDGARHAGSAPWSFNALLVLITGTVSYGALAVFLRSSDLVRAGVDGVTGFIGPKIVAFLQWFFGRPRPAQPMETGSMAVTGPSGDMGAGAGDGTLPLWMQIALWGLGAILAIAAIVGLAWALWRLWLLLMRRAGAVESAGVDASGSWDWWRGAWRMIAAALGRAWERLRRAGIAMARALGRGVRICLPRDVHDVYRGYLYWGRFVGLPRRPWETPGEYAARISAALPRAAEPATRLTEAFARAMYGPRKVDSTGSTPSERGEGYTWTRLRRDYRQLFRPGLLLAGWWVRFRT